MAAAMDQTLPRATRVLPADQAAPAAGEASVTLAFADRHRRRIALSDDEGRAFLLDLERATLLADGDRLLLADGGRIRVRAALEPVLEVSGRDPAHLARLAWHIGNRHVPLQVLPEGGLRILFDHVLAEMLAGLGAATQRLEAPFTPEPGAYGGHGH